MIKPPPYRSIRVIVSSIDVHEQLLKQCASDTEEYWRIQRTLAELGRQLDCAEAVWRKACCHASQ